MIDNADKFVEAICESWRWIVSLFTSEGNPNINRTLQIVRRLDVKTGLVLNPGTPVEASSAVLHLVDFVLDDVGQPGLFRPEFSARNP